MFQESSIDSEFQGMMCPDLGNSERALNVTWTLFVLQQCPSLSLPNLLLQLMGQITRSLSSFQVKLTQVQFLEQTLGHHLGSVFPQDKTLVSIFILVHHWWPQGQPYAAECGCREYCARAGSNVPLSERPHNMRDVHHNHRLTKVVNMKQWSE